MKIGLNQTCKQKFILTFSMRQALHMLQMPQQELSQWLLSEIEKNPLLELNVKPLSFSHRNNFEVEAPLTLHDLLLRQIEERFTNPKQKAIALLLLEHLDERGYLHPFPEDDLGPDLMPVLSILQSFDPPGIFAKDLQECLLLQLAKESPAYRIVDRCFQELLHGRFDTIKKITGISDFKSILQTLSCLLLRPADKFKQEHVSTVIADLSIEKKGKTWIIQTFDEELPKIHFRSDYLHLSSNSPEERKTLRSWSASGKWLIHSLNRRKILLLKIGAFLAQKQAPYLDQKGPLQSLTLQNLANHLHLHPSTLSRALSGKYAQTPRGLLPLNMLLSSNPKTDLAKQALKHLVAQEDKTRPLSDMEILQYLQERGFHLARRTVAKYRKILKISSASLRKNALL